MSGTRAISGIDLHVDVSGTRVSRSLEKALREAVTGGRLPAGTRLPSARTLAADLGIARNSVAEAYGQLAAEGRLVSRVGAGTWVAERPGKADPARLPEPAPAPALDLRGGIPDTSAFPREAWAAAVRRALARTPSADLGYGGPQGSPVLREALAGYLARTRGVRSASAGILVGNGFGDLLAATCRLLYDTGVRRIAVEEYGHGLHRRIARAQGLETVAVPVDEEGADVGLLDRLGAGAVLLTPAHQFPTGAVLSAERRRALARWACETGGLVLEDDYDGEFRYDRRSAGALQALAPDRVLYFGTASKALAPAVGLAWAAVPPHMCDGLALQRELSGGGHNLLGQLALAEFLSSHQYDRTVRRLRGRYRARGRAVASAVSSLEGFSVRAPEAGLHCLVVLPPRVREEDAVAEAARRGLLLEGLSSFADGGSGRHRGAVVVGHGASAPHLFSRALEVFSAAMAAAGRA
ncbi:PLP-dependent aminotransferase family protein [Nocardiopsis algeriensis]|uniref:GntR family transcriptional regulator/MocR family aminotransferase n=1 Tax=Nocardiopsis algeriensis TaxID=1478215 RepID=A0A841IMW2_9ACTN|nr:PLP-dependent aminotransferase family protein [Nocardiopsis algeriensis]MBB6120077.1 GntR family transcriptional regulator/MocR family aminotransferase [Nocardiopsis algeriensis]